MYTIGACCLSGRLTGLTEVTTRGLYIKVNVGLEWEQVKALYSVNVSLSGGKSNTVLLRITC